MKLLITFIALLMSGCSTTPNLPDEYVKCEHFYDSSRTIFTESFDNIEQFTAANCPDIIRDSVGECPMLIKITTVDDEVTWLTQLEFENYECKQMENTR